MYEIKSRVEEILEDLKNSGKVHIFSKEETARVNRELNEEIRKFDLECRAREAQSIEHAKHIYITF